MQYKANFPVAQSSIATKCEHVATNICNAAGRVGDLISRRALAPLRLMCHPPAEGGERIATAHSAVAKYYEHTCIIMNMKCL